MGSLADGLRQLSGPQGGKIPSLSGHERNPFFLNEKGKSFRDISLISGADSDKDGRAVVFWDYNRDGFLDLAICNANAPKLAIYRNQLAKLKQPGGFVKIRFEGGNTGSHTSKTLSHRDGYGCVVTATINNRPFRAEHRCGTGYAAQNSPLMHIGLGQAPHIDSLSVRWPSGKSQTFRNIPAGTLLICREQGDSEMLPYKAR